VLVGLAVHGDGPKGEPPGANQQDTVMTTKLNLITKTFEGASVRAVDHPEHGELLHAVDVLKVLGHPASAGAAPYLAKYGIPKEERVLLGSADTLTDGVSSISNGRAAFLTRSAVTRVLMGSTLPKTQAFRDWLAGDVVNAIVDTGGYLLNEAARDTAKADTRTSVPLPEEIGGAYAALIEARKAELEARMGELKALEAAATEAAEKRALKVKLMEAEAVAVAERGRARPFDPYSEYGPSPLPSQGPDGIRHLREGPLSSRYAL